MEKTDEITPATLEELIKFNRRQNIATINDSILFPFFCAAQHLSERVDQYLKQGCSRAELKAANDNLKKLMEQ